MHDDALLDAAPAKHLDGAMEIENRRWGGWWLAPLRLLIVLALWAPLPAAVAVALQVNRFATSLPEVPDLDAMKPKFGSRVETTDGWFLGGARATHEVPFEDLPAHVIGAVVAAEDENFFTHQAFSARAIARAALENYRFGRNVQGASTITQQVARQFLTREKSYDRKIKELLLARRIEANYPKSRVLAAYVGGVFWGHTAHGVTQAAWQYFGKSPRELDLGEAALLAGILPAPSRFSPFKDIEAARRERARVLRRMVSTGMISEEEAARFTEAPIELAGADDIAKQRMPRAYYAGLRFAHSMGDDAWAERGMRIVVPHDPLRQALARRALRQGVTAIDHRRGWNGSPGRAKSDAVDEALRAQPAGRFALARVLEVDARTVRVFSRAGEHTLPLATSDWAEPAATERHYKRPVRLRDFGQILEPNELVYVDFSPSDRGRGGERADPLLGSVLGWPPSTEPALAQVPIFEGAVVAIESQTGRMLAAVGGVDVETDEYDRAMQGCRQPGSVFKPIVYAEGLSRGLTAATMVSDVPTEVSTGRGDVWRPRNADRDFKGYVTFAMALAWSRNIPTVNLMDHLGPRFVVDRAKKLGVTESVLDTTSSVSLGASCMRPYEVAQVYGAFQRGGRTVRIAPISLWYDDQGAARDDAAHFAAHEWRTSARLARMGLVVPLPDRGVSENVAFIMTDLLRRVVTSGTAHDLPDDWLVAGKTGTTNEFDAWFVGFDERQTVAAWVGADKNRVPLGRGEHGATTALPVFASYYEPFARIDTDDDDYPGDPPPGVEYVAIDTSTGLLTPPGEWGTKYPFVVGTAPTELSPTRGTKQAQRVDELIYDF